MTAFRVGDRVEWDSRSTEDGEQVIRYGTVREDSPGALGFLRLLPDEDPEHYPPGDGTTCVKHYLLRHAAPVGVRDAIMKICGSGADGPWRGEIMADEIITLLVRAGHLPQPQAPIITVSVPGTLTLVKEN